MGYNTTVLILNDGFDQLEKYPEEFVNGIRQKMDQGGTIGVGHHANPAYVMPTQHADVPRLYLTHANRIVELSQYSQKTLKMIDDPRLREHLKDDINQAEYLLKQLKAYLNAIEKMQKELNNNG